VYHRRHRRIRPRAPLHLEPRPSPWGGGGADVLDNWQHHNEKQPENVHRTFGDVEWITIFFFLGRSSCVTA